MKEYKTVTVPEHTKKELALIRCDMCTVPVTEHCRYIVERGDTSALVRLHIYLCKGCLNRLAETNA